MRQYSWRYRALARLAAMGLGALAASAAGATACSVDYWVMRGGQDTNPGTAAQPFATLAQARDAVRADARRMQCEIVVNLGVDQRLTQTLQLDARDSGAPVAEAKSWPSVLPGVAQIPRRRSLSRSTASCLRLYASQRISSTKPSSRPIGVSRTSALSSRSCSRYSARDVNIR